MSWHTPIAPLAGQLITDVFWSQQITENINILKTPFTDLGILKWPAQAFSTTGTVNDLVVTSSVIRCTNAALSTITGFSGGVDGQLLLVENAGSSQVDIADQANTGSVATNRVINQVTGTISLAPSGRALLRYDGTSNRWKTLFHEQGAWITPTFAAGNFTANGAMTWTVALGNVLMFRYRLQGRTLHLGFQLAATTVGGTTNTALLISNVTFGGYQPTSTGFITSTAYSNNNGTIVEAILQVGGATSLAITRSDGGGWAPGTNYQYAEFFFEVT